MASPPSTAPVTFPALGSVVLERGDNDNENRWGGAARPTQPERPVADLQRALAAVGTYTIKVDGDFGGGTETALRRFQWFNAHSRQRLRVPAGGNAAAGTLEDYPHDTAITLTGQCGAHLAATLDAWNAAGARVTTLLVRVPISRFSRISRAESFTTLPYPNANSDEALANNGFVVGLDGLESAAASVGVQLHLNQTFRRQGIPPGGAVVPPATKSQHLIGQACDLNIVAGGTVIASSRFLNHSAPDAALKLVQAAKATGLRWGGDFGSAPDPVHFDRQIVAESEDYDMHFFFCQHGFELGHPIRLLT